MNRRILLDDLLRDLIGPNVHLYFQPPESKKLEYDCVVYSLSRKHAVHADNKPYRKTDQYTITVITEDPDSSLPDKFLNLPMCRCDRTFKSGNMNHTVFTLFF